MSSKYKYKNTGFDWIGEIPAHWGLISLKNAFYVIPSNVDKRSEDDEIEVELCNYVDVYYNDFINLSIDFMTATATEAEIKKFQLKQEDVIITKDSEDPFDIAVPAYVTEVKEKLLCGYHLSLLRTSNKKVNGSYLFWALKDEMIVTQLWREACGVTRWAIASRHIKNSIIPFPSKEEQNAIASYLSKACADIDKVIELKKKQIENSIEQLDVLMTDFTTLGLNHNSFQETGIEWLPKIPWSWKVVKLKRVLQEKLSYGANEPAENENTDEPRYIRITDFDDEGNLRAETFKSLPFDVAKDYLLNEGDVLFARSGATVGKTFIFKDYKGKACFAGYLIKAVTQRHKVLPEFLYYFTKTKTYQSWKNIIFTQATIQNIGADKYQYLDIPLPPLDEQQEIVKRIEALAEKTRSLNTTIRDQIDKLVDYKKSLIHEVVTGKKQVYFEGENTKTLKTKSELTVIT